MQHRTVIVSGPLAFHMRRLLAARKGENGLRILTLPLLAARLVGGFSRPVTRQDLDPAIRAALDAGGLTDLENIRELPGMTRAVARTLASIWDADLRLSELCGKARRFADMAVIEQRIRALLPTGALLPPDLLDAALTRIRFAPALLGRIELDRLSVVAPVWRPLLAAMDGTVGLCWRNPASADTGWFPGEVVIDPAPPAAAADIVSCADPHSEAVEALRWARELLASGQARPEDIAITAAATPTWDDHFLALAQSAGLPLHFSHGVPALSTREGQACASLADTLINGLSQDRVRRLFGHAAGSSHALRDLPRDWAFGLPREAGLFDVVHWRIALDRAAALREGGVDPRPLVLPILDLLARGPDAAAPTGKRLLDNTACEIWREALRQAPAEALEYSLRDLRVADGSDPGSCVVWCPASHLAGAPRPWVRLIGMTSRAWPRGGGEDPLLPAHLLPARTLDPDPLTEQDRRAFAVIKAMAARGCVLSRATRSAQGARLAPSPLLPQGHTATVLKRGRIPRHAFSRSDRLLARPQEAAATPAIAAAVSCWNDWRKSALTAHDGRLRPDHPGLADALSRTHSATSLRQMLRDPLGFCWRYGLGWRSTTAEEQPLAIDARTFGELVHELLKLAVDGLEPQPGYLRAARHEIEAALARAAEAIADAWPLERATPPFLLWRYTVELAVTLSLRALTLEESFRPGTRSWTEVPFGDEDAEDDPAGLPWNPRAPVHLGETGVRVLGRIDRVDLNGSGDIRVSDYKTGAVPKKPERIVLGGGAELQRAVYALAARRLLGSERRIAARLLYLAGDAPQTFRLQDEAVDSAVAELSRIVGTGIASLKAGLSLPGPEAMEDGHELRLALPAAGVVYFRVKQSAFARAFGESSKIWSVP